MGCWRNRATSTITITSTMVTRMRKRPICITICWKWLRECSCASATSATTLEKSVFMPVLTTTPSISPCLTMVLAKITSPVLRLTGSDSPVSEDWSTIR